MKIDTDDWVALSEVVSSTGIPQKTAYRIADRLGVAEVFFGIKCVRKKDIQRIIDGKKRVGNPDWIEDGEAASDAAEKAVASRLRRVATFGPTKKEVRRNKKLAKIGRELGGRPKAED